MLKACEALTTGGGGGVDGGGGEDKACRCRCHPCILALLFLTGLLSRDDRAKQATTCSMIAPRVVFFYLLYR